MNSPAFLSAHSSNGLLSGSNRRAARPTLPTHNGCSVCTSMDVASQLSSGAQDRRTAGRCCALAKPGYSRDHRPDRPQIVYGLMCAPDGTPVAVEVFEGNTSDPQTIREQIDKIKRRFKLSHVALVGDRGMVTSARISEELAPAGLDWISCLRAPQIAALANDTGPLQLSLFDERDLAEITSPDFPGERLVACRNPALAEERARKREELLQATERRLTRLVHAVQRKPAMHDATPHA
jgi:hypothetical protein